MSNTDELEFTVKRITYQNPLNGFVIARTEGGDTVVGAIPSVNVGETYRAQGEWKQNPKYGKQFQVVSVAPIDPNTPRGILAFLSGGVIKGLGPTLAKRLVDTFGTATFDVLNDAQRLATVPKIGPKKAKKIVESWQESKTIRDIYIFLHTHGITSSQAAKIFKKYAQKSIEKVRTNPYRLAFDIHGVGFLTCDKIAASLGIGHEHPERIKAGCVYYIDEACSNEGNVYVTGYEYTPKLAEKLGVDLKLVSEALIALGEQQSLILDNVDGEARYYLPKLHKAEKGCADEILRLAKPQKINEAHVKHAVMEALRENGITLSETQQAAVYSILMSGFSVLTGGPGVGKTTTSNVIIAAFENMGKQVVLASPTGRAAKRMTEVSGRPAKTVHRLLEYDPIQGGFARGRDYPLDGEVFIFDEASMLDIQLAHDLLKAIPDGATILFIGDIDQLPSVGPGTVLRDFITSGQITVCQLTEIFRQGKESKIVTSAYQINKGEMPSDLMASTPGADAYFLPREENQAIIDTMLKMITDNLLKKGFTPEDIQILAPQKKGDVGTENLNTILQAVLNPPDEEKFEHVRGQRTYRMGDRVMQQRNNYDRGVFNGDVGKVHFIDLDKRILTIDYTSTYGYEYHVDYEFGDLDEITLAYAMTIHKSQGSEYPCVIMPFTTSAWIMLQRNLLYTGATRARKFLVILGQEKALRQAVKTNPTLKRNTALVERIRKAIPRVIEQAEKEEARKAERASA